MTNRKLPDWIKSYLTYTDETEPPESYRRWVAISTVASALQRKVSIPMMGMTYPNMYIVLVGPSGCRKGTAMKPARKMIRELGIKIAVEASTGAALVQELVDCKEDALFEDTIYSHASLTVFSEEFTVFLGTNQTDLMATLCNWFDCDDDWTKRTIGRDKEKIINVWVNLLGATTPTLIQSTLPQDAIGGGLTSRMIFVYEAKKGKLVIFPVESQEEIELRKKLIHDLELIRSMHGEFQMSEGWIESYSQWRAAEDDVPPFKDVRFEGYFNRRAAHIIKLCMIVSASRSSEMVLTREDFETAISYLRQVERKMSTTFTGFGTSPIAQLIPDVMKEIGQRKTMPYSDLLNMFYFNADRELMNKCLDTLVDMKFCKRVHTGGDVNIVYLKEEKE